jgi:hypothetical protein
MSTDKHYFIEETDEGFAVRARGAERASAVLPTQKEAIARAKELNPNDHPDVERVLNTSGGGRDKWRPANKQTANGHFVRSWCPRLLEGINPL